MWYWGCKILAIVLEQPLSGGHVSSSEQVLRKSQTVDDGSAQDSVKGFLIGPQRRTQIRLFIGRQPFFSQRLWRYCREVPQFAENRALPRGSCFCPLCSVLKFLSRNIGHHLTRATFGPPGRARDDLARVLRPQTYQDEPLGTTWKLAYITLSTVWNSYHWTRSTI